METNLSKRNRDIIKESNVIRDFIVFSIKDTKTKTFDLSEKYNINHSRLCRYLTGKPGSYPTQYNILQMLNHFGLDVDINIKPYVRDK
jgi:hypothetical protein